MKRLVRILPHATIVMVGMFMFFWVLDILNPTMNLINRKASNKLMIIMLVLALITSIMEIYHERRYDRLKTKDDT
ncbi:hypothetical protein [Ruminococcus albus]|uniref:Uncharacterized protein n=1 Tax=Ruminococcus albus TaxID=1264 RepID=A0A1H7F2S1_RUMAL|nr:hypothetical protein [Ruminococcus albus]SEK20399.1 hypothetical protein SAMN05216469_10181 [Ruminococcus albus]